ncbi:hypothetical protein AHAS_Ahas18G0125400 [Arachis hypogaea]
MQQNQNVDIDHQLPEIKIHHPSAASAASTPTPTAGARRKIGVAVDLSDESAHAVRWAVHHYIRPGDAVVLLHVSPTNVLFGADWGSIDLSINTDPVSEEEAVAAANQGSGDNRRKLEDDFDAFTASKAADLARPLREAQIPYKIHIVKDHDMKERLCLEVERMYHLILEGSQNICGVLSCFSCHLVLRAFPEKRLRIALLCLFVVILVRLGSERFCFLFRNGIYFLML